MTQKDDRIIYLEEVIRKEKDDQTIIQIQHEYNELLKKRFFNLFLNTKILENLFNILLRQEEIKNLKIKFELEKSLKTLNLKNKQGIIDRLKNESEERYFINFIIILLHFFHTIIY